MHPNRLTVDGFSRGLFWDINPETLDGDKHINYIVRRVLEIGTLADWNLLCQQLSIPGIVKIAQNCVLLIRKVSTFVLS